MVMPFDFVAGARHREFEGVFHDPVGAVAREDGLLGGEFPVGALEHPAADARIFALGVFTYDVEVDVLLGAAGERRAGAGHQAAGPDAGILVEAAADGDEQAPERDVVRHTGPADRAQEHRVVLAKLVKAILGHHLAMGGVAFAGPVVVRGLQFEPEFGRRGFQHAQSFGNRLFADAVAGHCGDAVGAIHSVFSPGARRMDAARAQV